VPNLASMREPDAPVVVDTLYWMREAELKHGRCVHDRSYCSTLLAHSAIACNEAANASTT
jgi:hypothetical protein